VLVHEADPADREVVAFIVSCLTLGRASLVTKACRDLLGRIGSPLTERLIEPRGSWRPELEGFVYRFFSAARVESLLLGVGVVLRRHGTLEAGWRSTGQSGWTALEAFSELFRTPGADLGVLVPVAGSAGAAKRLNLFLRWMVRRDEIDVGGWSAPSAAELFMPIDTHVLQWARAQGLTESKTADKRACLEITAAFRTLVPEDPLRYDFAITRAGMESKNTLF